jgi:tetratricopeptide (TPR) repeat protein
MHYHIEPNLEVIPIGTTQSPFDQGDRKVTSLRAASFVAVASAIALTAPSTEARTRNSHKTPRNSKAKTSAARVRNGAKQATVVPIAIPVPRAARIAFERAKVLSANGVGQLAERELKEAVALAPRWIEPQTALARLYTRSESWSQAEGAWRNVLFLQRNNAEAQTGYNLARRNLRMVNADLQIPDLVALGHDSQNTLARVNPKGGISSTRMVAQTTERLAQAEASVPTTDSGTATSGAADSGTASTDTNATFPQAATSLPVATTSSAPATSNSAANSSAPASRPAASRVVSPRNQRATAPQRTGATTSRATARSTTARAVARPAAKPVTQNARRAATRRPAARTVTRVVPGSIRFAKPVSRTRQAAAWPLVNRAVRALQARKYTQSLSLYQQAVKTDPNNYEARLGVAQSYALLQRYPQAIQAYRTITAKAPQESRANRGLADALTYAQRYTEARAINDRILTRTPRDFASAYQNAQIATWTQSYDAANNYFRTALAIRPRDADVWTKWGESLAYSDRGPRARSAFERALQIRPNYAPALVGMGNVYSWSSDYPNAIQQYRAALRVQPRNAAALIGLGDALAFSGEPRQAAGYYRTALTVNPRSKEAQIGLGRALVIAGDNAAAIPQLRKVLAQDPRNVEALRFLAQAQSTEADTPAEVRNAVAAYERVLLSQRDTNDQALTLVDIARLQLSANDTEGARKAFEEARRRAPLNNIAAVEQARFFVTQDQLTEADALVAEVLQRDAENPRALALQVVIQSRQGNFARANALAGRLTAITPASTEEALQLATALQNAGNVEGGRRVLSNLLARTPNDPALLLQVANFQRDTRDWEGAVTNYRALLQLQPDNTAARLNLAEVLTWQQNFDAAHTEVRTILERDPQNTQARVLEATIALRTDTPEGRAEAETKARAILANDPQNVQAQNIIGQVLTSQQKFQDAISGYRATIAANPGNLEAKLGLARNLYYARQNEDSIEAYRELIRLSPDDTQVKLELAKIFVERQRFSDAEVLYNQVLATRRDPLPELEVAATGEVRATPRVSPSMALPLASHNIRKSPETKMRLGRKGSKAHIRLAQADVPTSQQNTVTGSSPAPAAGSVGQGSPNEGPTGPPDATAAPSTDTTPVETAPVAGTDNGISVPEAGAPVPVIEVPVEAPTPPEAPLTGESAFTSVGAEAPLADQIAALRGLGEIRRRQNRYSEALTYFRRALALDSSDPDTRLGLARSLRGVGDFPQALIETERVLATTPDHLEAQVLQAQLLGDTGKPEEAQQRLDNLIQAVPENPPVETWLTLSQAFAELRNYDTALQVLDVAKRENPNDTIVTVRTAEVLTAARRYDDALKQYDVVLATAPNDGDLLLGRARVFNYADRLVDAEPAYRRVLEVEPANYQATVELADILSRRNKYDDSIALYRRALDTNPTDAATRVELARVLRYDQQFEVSESELTRLLETDPNYAPAYTERGILRGQTGRYESGLADIRRALAITPDDLNAQFGLAEVQGYARQYEDSIKNYRAALERDPINQKGRTELGLVLSYSGRNAEALRELDTVLRANPQNMNARLARAEVLGRAENYNDSINLYRTVLNEEPTNRRAQLGLANVLTAARRYDEALKVYDVVLAADPTDTSVRIARGRTLGYANRTQPAIAALQPIVRAEPNNTEARLALAEVLTNSGSASLRSQSYSQYQAVLQADPLNDEARIGYGRALSYNGRYADSRAQFNQVLTRNPRNDEALAGLAETERFAGRPFEARDVYRRALVANPTNRTAIEGMNRVRRETSASITAYTSQYRDSNDVRVTGYGFGPTIRTRNGTVGLTYENGRYEDAGASLRRTALNLLLAKNFGSTQARLLLNRINYTNAPDRNLYDFQLSRSPRQRVRYFAGIARREIVESLGAVQGRITARDLNAGLTYPVASRLDLEAAISRLNYSDGNDRTTLTGALLYRILTDGPVFRVGLGYRQDDTGFISPLYYSPQDFRSFSALADYTYDRGPLRFGLSGAYPLSGRDSIGGINRPARTLFGYANYDVSRLLELFINGGVVDAPEFNSTQFNLGATYYFGK